MKTTLATGMTLAALLLGSAATAHPLDGLTGDEIRKATEILRASGQADDKTLYPLIELKEPPKAEVLAWKDGDMLDRKVTVDFATPEGFKRAIVNLTQNKVEESALTWGSRWCCSGNSCRRCRSRWRISA